MVMVQKTILVWIISLLLGTVRVMSLNYECVPNQNEVGLGVANCSRQSLSHVPPNLPHNIKVLDLSNNHISELLDYSFVKYDNLEILYLRNNSLTSLEEHTFDRLRNLLYLDLSFNNLAYIPSKTFRDLSSLLTLSLSGNRINLIPQDSFVRVTKVTTLDLSSNHIQYIYPDAFNGLSRLQQLSLQNNALTKLNSSVFQHFSTELREIKLYTNPWYCDCNLRWLLKWLQRASTSSRQGLRWKFRTDEPICQGPILVEGSPMSTLSTDWFVCPIHMYSKANNKETISGKEVELFCKYMADPKVDIQWRKDGKLIDVTNLSKYGTRSDGDIIITSWLFIKNFQYEDIGEYECYAENKLGHAFDSCLVTLEGVDPSTLLHPAEISETDDKNRVRNAIIASSTIGGVVFLLVLVGVLVFAIFKCKRYHKRKKESIRMNFEEHLKANGIIEPKPKTDQQIMGHYDDGPDGNISIDGDIEETESMYDSLQRPRVPSSTNTNTYISFKSEFSEPEDMSQIYGTGTKTSVGGKGSDGSQCESTSPLLENISPILIDPHDPFYEANLYVPRLNSLTANYLNSTHHRSHSHAQPHHYDDDNGFLPYHPHSYTLPHNSHVTRMGSHDDTYTFIPHRPQTLPHGYSSRHMLEFHSPQDVPVHTVIPSHKSASVGHLGVSPPKKPPRLFHSRDTMSLTSQGSQNSDSRERSSLRLSLPRPGTVDKYGTAV